MRKIDPSCVTTTGNIEGWAIRSYHGPVVAHVVTGAGWFTEFLAGLTDVFGGRSQAIRNRLSEINREVIEELARDAGRLGANWIVGMRIDMDEISGKGTMMFMVTASGTAVSADPIGKPEELATRAMSISLEQVRREQDRQRLAAIVDLEPFASDDGMREILDHRIASLAPVFLRWTREYQRSEAVYIYEKRLKWTLAYFANLDPNEASARIYAEVAIPPVSAPICETEILVRLRLLDFDRTQQLLESDDARKRWWGLQTLLARKAAYAPADLDRIDRCIRTIEARPADEAATVDVKRLLGRKQVWLCASGHENAKEDPRCACGLDRRGLRAGDMPPERAVAELRELRTILAAAFST